MSYGNVVLEHDVSATALWRDRTSADEVSWCLDVSKLGGKSESFITGGEGKREIDLHIRSRARLPFSCSLLFKRSKAYR